MQKYRKTILFAAFLILLLVIFTHIIRTEDMLWDFNTYYYGAKTFTAGQNPYDFEGLKKIGHVTQPFVYLPITLILFLPLSLLEFSIALYVFLVIKIILLVSLVVLWEREFLKQRNELLFYLFCLIVFNGTIFMDFVSCNVSIIEQFFIWYGFYFLIKNRPALFCGFIIVAASFKAIPILLLTAVLFSTNKKKITYLLGSGTVFLCTQLLTLSLVPEMYYYFFCYRKEKEF